jgi:hypothetical protein
MESTQLYSKKQSRIVDAIIAFINALFLLKYLPRYVHHSEIYIIAYLGLISMAYWAWENKKVHVSNTFLLLLIGLFTLAFITALQLIPAAKLNVDRWSGIYSFWQTWFKGNYPYNSLSHLGKYSGPLPVYFLFALPFYALKEIGYMSLLASVLFILYLVRLGKRENSDFSFAILVLLMSPCIYWEIIARSTLFFFSFLWLVYAEWFLSRELKDKKSIYLSGIIGGLLLSTRIIYAMLLCMWAVYIWKRLKSIKQIVLWGIIVALVFAATILPFWLIYPNDFIQHNPFTVESSYVPFSYNFIFLAIVVIGGILCKNKQSVLFLCGLSLFLIILIYLAYHVFRDGWDNALANSYVDISYFIIPFPFLIASLRLEMRQP